ncbi:hypothetical protein [Acutalibacter muris]|uniref:hypothetical protein n=1 Tax=Acutalibacter muris TaxID=1796620 RepID=UPI00272D0C6E|nr:hypothetical protein [Acutalibacter muris]
MNKARRKRLAQAFDLVNQAKNIIDEVRDDEREAYENLPDSFQNGERGEEMQGYLEMLDETYNYLDDANSVIDQI